MDPNLSHLVDILLAFFAGALGTWVLCVWIFYAGPDDDPPDAYNP